MSQVLKRPGSDHSEPTAAGPNGVRELYHDPYITVSFDEQLSLFRFVRSAQPLPELEGIEKVYITIAGIMDRIGRKGRSLLTDLRAAPGRNDPAFESLMLKLRPLVQKGFARQGLLVATAVGAMQIRRLAREEGTERTISHEEAELLRYLTEPTTKSSLPAAPLKPRNPH